MERWFENLPWHYRAFILFRRLCICGAAGVFYAIGLWIAGQYFFSLTEDQGFFFIWIPSSIVLTIAMFLKAPVWFAAWEKKQYGFMDEREADSGEDR